MANPHATATLSLARLHAHLDDAAFGAAARQAAGAYDVTLKRAPAAFSKLLAARAFVESAVQQVVVCGTPGSDDFVALQRLVGTSFAPYRILVHGAADTPGLPRLAGRPKQAAAAVYICEGHTCLAALSDLGEVAAALKIRAR
ncbi:MAG: hypothetical protein EON47_24655 [Acetobacteraceae bacterium]|nr:MAG: hypothetical protein EON47_24655 [Acetobacteraceae bacterium]